MGEKNGKFIFSNNSGTIITQCHPPALLSTRAYQDLHGRWLDGDVDGVEVSLLDAPHALHVDVKYTDEVPGLDGLHGRFARAVHVP